ncbi:hypothetical protein AA042_21695 [Pseudomonas lundensis]|uniref:hypothetical protein n=1 Tax=Pseudomonas lundensis TaxID=86185 RepID=UPI0006427271|nr:hypothetical protein [Pseudomonas lundensis]AOZ14966.1 hypothetical protein AA042_21695 [Pseudomonas lundensis]QVQ77748.1 hypothetical protein KIN24_01140 [Pseudomonas lundensis]QVQ83182.1 hypothetical protein KIY13_08300 [Pseudomonas lundensis]
MTDNTDLKRLAQRVIDIEALDGGEPIGEAWGEFEAAATPAAVLALIAENERLHESDQEATELCDTLSVLLGEIAVAVRGPEEPKSRHGFHDLPSRVKTVVSERDQLKADNERLRADYAGLARFNPEWDRAAAAQDSVREHMAMVVQLKAEVAGLRTGYEAYERVNAELKAENERLERNRDMWKGQVERQTEELRLAHEADKLLKSECEGLRESLTHAADEVESWGAYASDYFQQKHDLAGTVLKVRQAAVSKESGQ